MNKEEACNCDCGYEGKSCGSTALVGAYIDGEGFNRGTRCANCYDKNCPAYDRHNYGLNGPYGFREES